MQLGCDRARQLSFRLAWVQFFAGERVERGPHLFHRELGRPLVVVRHELVVDRHNFSVDLARRVHEPDRGRRFRFVHLVAVESFQHRDDENGLWRLAEHLLQLPARENVEELVGSPEFDVGLDRDRVVRLQERVEKVLDGDGSLLFDSLAELLAREHLLRREARAQLDDVTEAELPIPLVLENNPCVLARHDQVELVEVGFGVRHHLVAGLHRPADFLVRRIADLRRPIADDEDDLVAPLRQLS